MQLEHEARVWQTIGIISWSAGAGMLVVLMMQNGVVRVTNLGALSTGLAASFIMLAGIAGTVFGRVLHAVVQGYSEGEHRLWRLFALVCCSCGAFAVLYVAISRWNQKVFGLSLTSLTVGLAGSFLIMAGIICLLGNRVMQHATEKYTHGETAKAAGA